MRLRGQVIWHLPCLLLTVTGCAAPRLGPMDGYGLVVFRATVTVQCLKTGFVNPSGMLESPGKRRGVVQVALQGNASAGSDRAAGPIPAEVPGKPRLWLIRHNRGHGSGYVYVEPPCVDAPASFAADTNTIDHAWIEGEGRAVEGRRVGDLLLFDRIPPGAYRLTGVVFNYSFGGQVYVSRIPNRDVPPQRFPEVTLQVGPGEPRYAGALSIRATRDVAFVDRFSAAFGPDPEAEAGVWRELQSRFPNSDWSAAIALRLKTLHP